jgi:hypothetical protein
MRYGNVSAENASSVGIKSALIRVSLFAPTDQDNLRYGGGFSRAVE